MSAAPFTPGPWVLDSYYNIKTPQGETVRTEGVALAMCSTDESKANARLIAASPELLAALEAYRSAEVMPVYGDSSDFVGGNVTMRKPGDSAWGYICDKHGLGYQGGCICCHDEHRAYADRKDRDARYARDEALRAAAKLAKSAIAKATGEPA